MTLIDRFLQVSIHWCPEAAWVRLGMQDDEEGRRGSDEPHYVLSA